MQTTRLALLGGAAMALASSAYAGGVERSTQSTAILFEQGTYAELTFGRLDPSVSGVLVDDPDVSSGDMLGSENVGSFAFKTDITENVVAALVIDKPVGATINYPTGTGHDFEGSKAELDSKAITAYLMYKFQNGFSLYGGLRMQYVEGQVTLPTIPGYELQTNKDHGELGYSVGVAYERPDIALRVALTYNSAIDHRFEATETSFIPGFEEVVSDFDTTIPQSVNLEFQTGIAEDTLLFGSIRWVDWSEFDINPSVYGTFVPYSLASYEEDSITYKLGVGRRFNENWAGSFTLIYEPEVSEIFGNLGPIDGRTGVALGLSYSKDNIRISGGVEYSWLGDAKSQNPAGAPGDPISDFRDNTAISYGIRIGYYF